jgi:hypothetical protein
MVIFWKWNLQSKLIIWNQISIPAHMTTPLSQKILLSKALIELVLLKDSFASNRAQNQDLNGVCVSVDFTGYYG